ncbi:hypothetical protein [Prochlorococcus marinus]|uniref:hypothetical protein n=1 Tax=Prochlorococcus marinus TaxID=1219 RepID=UPI0022B35A3B|nr:hypothetical protein [Prochlorococcus marinus]
MKRILLAFLITLITLCSTSAAIAAQDIDKKISSLENKVSKKFAKTFCNTTGFGISEEGALKFALGETKGEFVKNPLISKINIDELKDEILDDIAYTCNYFDFSKSDLDELTLN